MQRIAIQVVEMVHSWKTYLSMPCLGALAVYELDEMGWEKIEAIELAALPDLCKGYMAGNQITPQYDRTRLRKPHHIPDGS